MKPVVLETPRLRLDSPVAADRDLVLTYCQDPLFERYLTLPWPYTNRDAGFFLGNLVPRGWETATEYTWALRLPAGAGDTDEAGNTGDGVDPVNAGEARGDGGTFLGVLSYRAGLGDIGFWIGPPHRGKGYMTEAVTAATTWLFGRGARRIGWECVAGNVASASVARKCGFRYAGERPSSLRYRDGTHPPSWFAVLRPEDTASVHPGWPALLDTNRTGNGTP